MSILTFFLRLQTIGIVLTKFGELLIRIGAAPSLTEIVREEKRSDPGQEGTSQDSLDPLHGVKDEEPAYEQVRDASESGDLFETSRPD